MTYLPQTIQTCGLVSVSSVQYSDGKPTIKDRNFCHTFKMKDFWNNFKDGYETRCGFDFGNPLS